MVHRQTGQPHIPAAAPSPWSQLFERPWTRAVIISLLFLFGLAVRLHHITDPPLDFHPARQYYCANRAHALYLMEHADAKPEEVALARANADFALEPLVIERIAVTFYQAVDGEFLVVPRLLSALYWLLGGFFLYLLAARIFGGFAAFGTAAVYLLLPYGVVASKAFQPDPLMTLLMIAAWYYLWRYGERRSLGFLLAGALCAAAGLFIKISIIFFILPFFLAVILARPTVPDYRGWRWLRDPHVWLFGLVALLPAAIYYVNGLFFAGFLRTQAANAFLPYLIGTTFFWRNWGLHIRDVFSIPLFAAALFTVCVIRRHPGQYTLTGLWIGYLLYGLFFSYAITTHNYYQLPMIPILALTLGGLGQFVGERLAEKTSYPLLAVTALVIVIAMGLATSAARRRVMDPSFALYPQMYAEIGSILEHSRHVVALTQAYAEPLRYYGQLNVTVWPWQVDLIAAALHHRRVPTVEERLHTMIAQGAEYFVVTDIYELSRQRPLAILLDQRYPQLVGKTGYYIFDLRHPKEPAR